MMKEKHANNENRIKENFTVLLTDPMLYDRLHTLAAEYSISVESLVNVAVKRLIDDIDFMRDLRTGKADMEAYYISSFSK